MAADRLWGRGVEWEAVCVLLASGARTPLGRDRARAARPSIDIATVRLGIEETRQARQALQTHGSPPLDGVPDVRPVLGGCHVPGSVLDGPTLLTVVPFLDAVPRLHAWARTVRTVCPLLAGHAEALPLARDLRDAIRGALDDDGAVRDEASARLRQVRRGIREQRRRIVLVLERLLATSDADLVFAERFVTLRHGRYVLPVRAEARARVRGIVHDRSQSGHTLFVEPAGVVEANNDLVQLVREEEQETARVLAELTDRVRERRGDLEALAEGLGALDWVFARADLAERMGATVPTVEAGDRRVALRGARHPLLLAQGWERPERPVVPVDLELDAARPLLVITGPNAGGKTVALKTLALHVLLAQTGCHLPAEEGARLPLVGRLHAIIGDDQSVAENLSTFSAFVKQVREILESADDRSLVLLDELGAGTDPEEGAALAQAILETLAERGALVMATTHLEPLKAFASTHPRARNASAEFDAATLAPTFRLRYDRPGQSYALTIAARLGLDPALIRRAQAHRTEHATRMADLLARLDEHARTEAVRALAIERQTQEAAARLAAAHEAEAAARAQASELVGRARAEAAQVVADVRRAVAAEWERLKRAERSRRDVEDSRRRLAQVAARLAPAPAEATPAEVERLRPGATVAAEHLGLCGELVDVVGAMATLRAGTVTVRVPLHALRPVAATGAASPASDIPPPPGRVAPARRQGIAVPEKTGVATELHLLGRTTDEARDLVEQYVDDAFMAGLATVRLVHGKGTGALRRAVRDLLAAHPLVDSFRDGEPSEGGTGATVAALRVG